MFEQWEPKQTSDIVRTNTGVFLLRCKCGFITEHATGVLAVNVLLDRIRQRELKRLQGTVNQSQTILDGDSKARRIKKHGAKNATHG